ncbi:hypothetical protein C8J57DRAFT_1520934 [Mycena rebaudengoi]|nr:hypothetical protein C8J57DRAFT_1520934 [Mycena rebaudengoi]
MEAIHGAKNEPTFPDAHPDAKGQTKDVNDSTNDAAAETTEAPVKRGRGRPKGSKKKKPVPAAAGEGSSVTPLRKRGLPSKEKKDNDEKYAEDSGSGGEEPTPKRKHGCPPKPQHEAQEEGPATHETPLKFPRLKRPNSPPASALILFHDVSCTPAFAILFLFKTS